ncbi:hypothetical protein ANN_26560, partial [Periplaneta americana]
LTPHFTRPPRLYRLPKIHKKEVPLRSIVNAIGSSTYRLAKHITSLLNPVVGKCSHHVKNSAEFIKVSLKETLELLRPHFPPEVIELCNHTLSSSYFIYKGQYYEQSDGVAVGSPLSPAIANLYMEDFEHRALENVPLKPAHFYRYVDDTLVFWPHGEAKLQEFQEQYPPEHPVHERSRKRWLSPLLRHSHLYEFGWHSVYRLLSEMAPQPSKVLKYTQSAIAGALKEVKRHMLVKTEASKYGVPKTTLLYKVKGKYATNYIPARGIRRENDTDHGVRTRLKQGTIPSVFPWNKKSIPKTRERKSLSRKAASVTEKSIAPSGAPEQEEVIPTAVYEEIVNVSVSSVENHSSVPSCSRNNNSDTAVRHNCRIWGSENPHVVRELERDNPKINVWCRLTHETVIGPFFFVENTISGNVYLDMLQNYVIPQIPQGYVFQQDGAPPHYALHVTDHLNECFPQRWIGRGGPTAWPPRSPDLTPLDFFFWGYIKDIVYKTVVADLEDLRRRIVAACATVTPEML